MLDERLRLGEEILTMSVDTEAHVTSAQDAYENWHEFNVELLSASFTDVRLSLDYRRDWPEVTSFYPTIDERIESLRYSVRERSRRLTSVLGRLILFPEPEAAANTTAPAETMHPPHPRNVPADSRGVFVVHGRDEGARRGVFEFLRALDLRPMEWSRAIAFTGKTSPYVGEVLSAALENAQAIVVLLTPDDEARLRPHLQGSIEPDYEKDPTPQARPNVIFEAGMAIAYAPERTIIVELQGTRPFSDIAGRHIIRLDNSPRRRNELAERLRTAGCPASTEGTDWLGAGDLRCTAPGEVGPPLEPENVGPPGNIALSLAPAAIVADGTQSAYVNALVTDADGSPIDDVEVRWILSGGGRIDPHVAVLVAGHASAIVTPSRTHEDGTITVACQADGLMAEIMLECYAAVD